MIYYILGNYVYTLTFLMVLTILLSHLFAAYLRSRRLGWHVFDPVLRVSRKPAEPNRGILRFFRWQHIEHTDYLPAGSTRRTSRLRTYRKGVPEGVFVKERYERSTKGCGDEEQGSHHQNRARAWVAARHQVGELRR